MYVFLIHLINLRVMHLKDSQCSVEVGELLKKLCADFPQFLDHLAMTDTTTLVNLLQILHGSWNVDPQPHIIIVTGSDKLLCEPITCNVHRKGKLTRQDVTRESPELSQCAFKLVCQGFYLSFIKKIYLVCCSPNFVQVFFWCLFMNPPQQKMSHPLPG